MIEGDENTKLVERFAVMWATMNTMDQAAALRLMFEELRVACGTEKRARDHAGMLGGAMSGGLVPLLQAMIDGRASVQDAHRALRDAYRGDRTPLEVIQDGKRRIEEKAYPHEVLRLANGDSLKVGDMVRLNHWPVDMVLKVVAVKDGDVLTDTGKRFSGSGDDVRRVPLEPRRRQKEGDHVRYDGMEWRIREVRERGSWVGGTHWQYELLTLERCEREPGGGLRGVTQEVHACDVECNMDAQTRAGYISHLLFPPGDRSKQRAAVERTVSIDIETHATDELTRILASKADRLVAALSERAASNAAALQAGAVGAATAPTCPECGGTGKVQLFTSTAPCSRGCRG